MAAIPAALHSRRAAAGGAPGKAARKWSSERQVSGSTDDAAPPSPPHLRCPSFLSAARAPAAGWQYLLQRGSYLSFRPFLNDLGCEPRRAPWSTTGPERSRGAGMSRRVRPAPTPPPTGGGEEGPSKELTPLKEGG